MISLLFFFLFFLFVLILCRCRPVPDHLSPCRPSPSSQFHPGLEFLKETTEFQKKYAETVVYRIFYSLNRCGREQAVWREGGVVLRCSQGGGVIREGGLPACEQGQAGP